jgi:hypothetical protein
VPVLPDSDKLFLPPKELLFWTAAGHSGTVGAVSATVLTGVWRLLKVNRMGTIDVPHPGELPGSVDVVIVGGGVIGCSTAFYATEA